MKKIILLLNLVVVLLFSSHTYAQQQAERLKSYAQFGNKTDTSFTSEDSVMYFYSGIRSIDTVWETLQAYDSAYMFYYQAGTGLTFYQLHRAVYDARDNVQSDTLYKYDTLSASFVYSQLTIYNYDNTGLPDTTFSLYYNNNAWDTVQTNIRQYDNAGHVTLELSLAGTDTQNVYYLSYTAAGLYRSTQAYEFNIFHNFPNWYILNIFDSLGRFDTVVNYFRPNSTAPWKASQLSIYYYDTTGYESYELTYEADSSGWVDPGRTYPIYDSHHNATQYIYQGMDSLGSWVNQSRNFNVYDSFNMRTIIAYGNNWDTANGGSWAATVPNIYYLHYEPYTLPNGIADIQASGDLRLYPVPAADMLQLSVKWNEAQSSTATIYDATGRKYTEWPLPCTDTYQGYIPVAMLPAGTYVLQVKGEIGTVTRSFDVRR